jgi:hypothetical protein
VCLRPSGGHLSDRLDIVGTTMRMSVWNNLSGRLGVTNQHRLPARTIYHKCQCQCPHQLSPMSSTPTRLAVCSAEVESGAEAYLGAETGPMQKTHPPLTLGNPQNSATLTQPDFLC